MWQVPVYFCCLGGGGRPVGASFGLQANALPWGAQQVPLMVVPSGVFTLQSLPLVRDLHAASASGGGSGGGPLGSVVCAATAPMAAQAVQHIARPIRWTSPLFRIAFMVFLLLGVVVALRMRRAPMRHSFHGPNMEEMWRRAFLACAACAALPRAPDRPPVWVSRTPPAGVQNPLFWGRVVVPPVPCLRQPNT